MLVRPVRQGGRAPSAARAAAARTTAVTPRFLARREAIVTAASTIINSCGIDGMTLADVAARAGLGSGNMVYYFRRKEDLTAAAFDRTLDYLLDLIGAALSETDPPARIRRFLALHIARLSAMRSGDAPTLAVLSDMRATDDPERRRLFGRWREVFRLARTIWGPAADRDGRDLFGARAHVLLETAFWASVWIERYEPDEWPRVEERLVDVALHGVAAPGRLWDPTALDPPTPEPAIGRAAFLDAATRLINQSGHRGASVERIAAELRVTKGSFYHHLDAKGDLVEECYARTYETLARAQRDADCGGGNGWQRLSSAIAALVTTQLTGEAPLLRTTAMRSLPADVRARMLERSHRIARRFADVIADGIADGSCRAIDATIGAQALMALPNAAFDMRRWASSIAASDAVRIYAATLLYGMVDRPRP